MIKAQTISKKNSKEQSLSLFGQMKTVFVDFKRKKKVISSFFLLEKFIAKQKLYIFYCIFFQKQLTDWLCFNILEQKNKEQFLWNYNWIFWTFTFTLHCTASERAFFAYLLSAALMKLHCCCWFTVLSWLDHSTKKYI